MLGFEEAKTILKEKGQEHVLKYYDELDAEGKKALLNQIEKLDFGVIEKAKKHEKTETGKITPIPALDIDKINENRDEYKAIGLKEIKAGKIGCVLLAGGMGTRLGLDKPKGELNFGLTRTYYLFQKLIDNVNEVRKEADGASIPFYIMTSEKNDAETRSFFEKHDYFGYPKEDIQFFIQKMAPAVDYDGRLYMEEKGRIATSPNGNGGWFTSMEEAGLIEDVDRRGLDWINIFSVDNPLQRMADPVFIGATIASHMDCGAKVVRKAYPEEKMGVMCLEDGHPGVIEYYELSEEMANERDEKGNLLYGFGVILNYLFYLPRLKNIAEETLPIHVVEKKIPYIDEEGKLQKPSEPNGYKFETLVVDMVKLMNNSLPFEVVREKEFAPIKNLHGKDSLDSARELLKADGFEL
jgi:UDP-N-acetylglucosamine/UDP-N-acetylgalactosamine diphosphorylase